MKKLLILLSFWCAAISANAALITIDVEDKNYGINDTLTANVIISELEDSLGFQVLVSEFAFDFNFEESLLDFGQVTFGNKLDVESFFGDVSEKKITYSPSQLTISEVAAIMLFNELDDAQRGLSSFLLASIDFTVIGQGDAKFSLSNVEIYDDLGNLHETINTQVAVPEPSTVAILVLALLMLISMKRKAKH
ncbi:PEP-CTERM sorting domain-containing protein [Colwellia sp. 6M3]|jgi:hypothetical protein|uniref:PEP-CTERM sorting domain-containing protein n=1 Tax=Colwellia sp. 6M3 TaxID=2759849 RepID=UPI0015F5D577|nr:PEP-CTERM sorting domain-containing protein [Colwellia sp. 6M3]MBA6415356.1 PEP-CTERM sorting domain-containing protein [Colwellia sp. 6M3]